MLKSSIILSLAMAVSFLAAASAQDKGGASDWDLPGASGQTTAASKSADDKAATAPAAVQSPETMPSRIDTTGWSLPTTAPVQKTISPATLPSTLPVVVTTSPISERAASQETPALTEKKNGNVSVPRATVPAKDGGTIMLGTSKPAADDASEPPPAGAIPVDDPTWGLNVGDRQQIEIISKLWRQMKTADTDSPEFAEAKSKLEHDIPLANVALRDKIAAAMMDIYADDSVNSAAMEFFGNDPIAVDSIDAILTGANRTPSQRTLLQVYYSLCRAELKNSLLSEKMQDELAIRLGRYIELLAGKNVGYGEQRLLTKLCQYQLTRLAGKQDVSPPARRLMEAMEKYSSSADAMQAKEKDTLAESMKGWLAIINDSPKDETVNGAVILMGHWDPLSRIKAAAAMQRLAEKNAPEVASRAESLLIDPRDEVRAEAARVFSSLSHFDEKTIIPRMISILAKDRSVMAQVAAAEVLAVRADQAADGINTLMACAADPRAGQYRRSNVLKVLAKIIQAGKTTADQRKMLLALGIRSLTNTDVPEGSLELLAALGAEAMPAIATIEEYRDKSGKVDRLMRAYINTHIIPAINRKEVGTPDSIDVGPMK